MVDSMKNLLSEGEKIIIKKIREKAIESAKARLETNGIKREDLNEEEFEVIVKEEQDKFISDAKDTTIIASLSGLALSMLLGV
jgi:phosphoribosyl-ATP pyrophosphohydrolase